MGKPYAGELAELPQTYRWALDVDVQRLSTSVAHAAKLPLTAVGSGGSFTVAEFAASLHREAAGMPAAAQTPMQTVGSSIDLRPTAVFMPTAGGSNPDVLGSFQRLAAREPRSFLVLCLSTGSPLSRLAGKMPYVNFVEFDAPCGKDGFLATNSLLASVVLLARAYAEACATPLDLPGSVEELLPFAATPLSVSATLSRLWDRDTLVVLHDATTRTAAVDLESKFTEAALGNVRPADYRHFAHGRHHWLAKRPHDTSVLAFVTPKSEMLAAKTLALLPRAVTIVREEIPFSGILAEIAALVRVLHIAGSAGLARGIDPGRPGVPPFGRRIYHLNPFPAGAKALTSVTQAAQVAIERKTTGRFSAVPASELSTFWRQAYATFVQRLRTTSFRGLVLDYDGTLCGPANRYGDLSDGIGHELSRLAKAGVVIGIATGRGKSVRKALRNALPKRYWGRVLVGYYNGGDIGLLSDDSRPDGSAHVCGTLEPLADALLRHPLLARVASLEMRLPQITVEAMPHGSIESIWAIVQHVVAVVGAPGTSVLRSGHSLDVLAPGVDKRAVVQRVASVANQDDVSRILCIGDRGRHPGNDYLLLAAPTALSVDEVSPDPTTCWNLAPVGHRCDHACYYYLTRLKASKGMMRFSL